LLVQEQQSKAKITSQLLQSQGRLEEERQAAEAASRELTKVRIQVADERAKRQEAEETRERLSAEAELLRSEQRQLQDLRTAHEELRKRHAGVAAELQTRQERCAQLESMQEQLRTDLEKATESHQKASQQHAELQTRARQAQERSDRLEQQYVEAKREADWAEEEGTRLEKELALETAARKKLEGQVDETKDKVSKAEASEKSAREALDAATAKRAELECQASAAHADLEVARAGARQAQQRQAAAGQLAERLYEAGKSLSSELRRRAEAWDKALAQGHFEGLDEALATGGPTFAQTTCRVETSPTKSQHEPGELGRLDDELAQTPGEAEDAQPPKAVVTETAIDAVTPMEAPVVSDAPVVAVPAPSIWTALPPAVSMSVLAAPGLEPATSTGQVDKVCDKDAEDCDGDASMRSPAAAATIMASPFKPGGSDGAPISVDDELLAAAEKKSGSQSEKVPRLSVTELRSAPTGCSTAWSLELLDAQPLGDESEMDIVQPAKRLRRD